MPDLKDNISLTLPTTIPANRRASLRRQWATLLNILNGPDQDAKGRSLKTAKANARRGMHQLRAEIAQMGGRMDIDVTSAQTDPTTGEITTSGGRGVIPTWSLGGADVQSGRAIESATHSRAVTSPLPMSPLQPTAAPTSKALPSGPSPLMSPADPRNRLASMPPPTTEKGSMQPDPVPSSMEPSLTPPATQGAPTAPAETPEMQRLRALLAEEAAEMPSGELSLGQKIAFGLIAGIHGPEAALKMADGQKTEAVQRFLMQRRERESLIDNLTALVGLQQQQAAQDAATGAGAADDMQKATDRANAFFQAASQVSATATTADAIAQELAADPSPAFQARALDLSNQRAALVQQLNQLNENIRANPQAMLGDDAPLRTLTDANRRLADLTLAATSDLADRAKSDALPDTVSKELAALQSINGALDSALRQIEAGAGGPVEGFFFEPVGSVGNLLLSAATSVSDAFAGKVEAYGRLQATLAEPEQVIRTVGPGARIAPEEMTIFGGLILKASDSIPALVGRIKGFQAWVNAKQRFMQGDPNAQLEADKIRLRVEMGRPWNDASGDPIIGAVEMEE